MNPILIRLPRIGGVVPSRSERRVRRRRVSSFAGSPRCARFMHVGIESLERRDLLALAAFTRIDVDADRAASPPADSRVLVLDVNHDGRVDLATFQHDTLYWHPAVNEPGEFGSIQKSSLTNAPFHTADINGDGRTDLLSRSNRRLMWHAASPGADQFQPHVIAPGIWLNATVDDFDADGDPDIIAQTVDAEWALFRNQSGDFTGPHFIPIIVEASGRIIESGDVDGDHDADLIVSEGRLISLWRNQGDGLNWDRTTIIQGSAEDAVLHDLNSDNLPELLLHHSNEGELRLFQNGSGTFTTSNVVAPIAGGLSQLQITDWDDDGVPDIVYQVGRQSSMVWRIPLADQPVNASPQRIARNAQTLSDLDGDGDLDIVLDIRHWQRNSAGTVEPAVTIARHNYPTAILIADVNGDTRPDVIAKDLDSSIILWQANLGTGLGPRQPLGVQMEAPAEPNGQPLRAAWILANADADSQAIFLSVSGDCNSVDVVCHVGYQRHLGDATFSPLVNLTGPVNEVLPPQQVDWDRDEHPDVLLAFRSYESVAGTFRAFDTVVWYEFDRGDETQVRQQVLLRQPHRRIRDLAVADLDQDGVADLLLVDDEGTTLYHTELNGPNDQNELVELQRWPMESLVTVADTNGDGLPDLLTRLSDDTIVVRRSLGHQQFDEPTYVVRHDGPVELADIDLDGRLDVVTIGPIVAWFANHGNDRFSSEARTIATGVDPSTPPEPVDFDQDGDLDFLFRGAGGNELQLALNRWIESDLNQDQIVDLLDLDLLSRKIASSSSDSRFDLTRDGTIDIRDLRMMIDQILEIPVADVTGDQRFDTRDLIEVFQVGKYEQATAEPVGWLAGDWNADGRFDSRDLVFALQEIGPESPLFASPHSANRSWNSTLLSTNDPAVPVRSGFSQVDLDGNGVDELLVTSAQSGPHVLSLDEAGRVRQIRSWSFPSGEFLLRDLDDDGQLELLEHSTGALNVYEIVGRDSPEYKQTIYARNVTEVIDVGDVDGDGRLDVLARVSDRLAWLRQDQNGLFEAIAIHPMRFRDQRLADVDGDGDLDILSETSWLENLDGVGRFAYPSRSLALEPLVEVFEVLDLDRDGDLDLLGRDAESRLVVKLQRPGEQDLTATLLPFVRSINVSHGDLDYDTQPDLIIGFDRGTYLFEFTTKDHAPELRQVIVDSGQLGQAAIARLIPNELPTLLIPQTDALTGWQYQDDAQQLELQFSLPRRSAAITELVAADLNGDSRPDIALLTNDGRAVEWQRNEGNKAFAARELLAELPFEAVQIQDIDVNRDGRLDLLIVPKTRDRLLALVQTDSSGWEVRLIASMPPEVGHGVLAVTIGDVDRDGQDEIVALWDAYTIIAYEPHLLEPSEQLAGRILFLATVSDGPNIDAMVLEVADVNGDGVPDVASPMIDYLQASDGTFSARWIQRSDSHLTDAARADLDGDGDLEVITVSDQLTILTYAPALDEYIEVRSVALEYDVAGVQAIDVDHDGDLDLLLSHPHAFSTSGSSSPTTTELAWIENKGNLRWGAPRPIQTALGGFTVDAIDLDDDGLLEIIAAARLMNTVEWLRMV